MKKLLALLCILIVSLSSTVVFASSNVGNNKSVQLNNKQIIDKLIKIGFTQEQISLMSDGTKEHIAVDTNVKGLVEFKTTTLKESRSTDTAETGDIQPTGVISSSDLSCNIITVSISPINGQPALRIYEDFQWITAPTWNLTDHVAITWSQGWYANSYSMKVSYIDPFTGSGTVTGNAYEIVRSGGIAWDYDLKGNWFNNGRPSGYAYVNLTKNDPSLPGSSYSAAEGRYIHDYNIASVSISISPSDSGGVLPGVSFGMDSAYDVAVRSVSWLNSTVQ